MDTKKPPKEIGPFIRTIKKKFKPERIILFGSHAKGTAWKQSDYDIMIISSSFEGKHWFDRISEIVSEWDLLCDIDVLPYTPQELERKKQESSVVRAALREGILIG